MKLVVNKMTNKHYFALADYYEKLFHKKIAKIALNANFTCPNKDGTKGIGGCTYCSKLGSGDTAGDKNLPLELQYLQVQKRIVRKWPNASYIFYLQANSNTYADINTLKELYERVLQIDPLHTAGLSIATRPDCFTEDIYNYLEELNKRTHLTIELGLQTSNEQTAKKINRCSTNEEFITAVLNLRKRNIEVVVHIINGLPWETKEDMMNTIEFLNQLDISGIKFHSLLVLKDTLLYKQYQDHPFPLLSLEEYASIVTEQIRRLKPNIVIHRLAADALKNDVVLPDWTQKKLVIMNTIDKLFKENDYYQGDLFTKPIQNH